MHTEASSGADRANTASELQHDFAQCISDLDKHCAVRLMTDAVAEGRIGVADLYTLVLGPYLAHVGTSWQHSTERVWEEHFASHVVRTVIEALYPTVMREAEAAKKLGKTVLLACPPREEHQLGLRMLSDRFELAGWDVVYLGANTPIAEIVAAALSTNAAMVAMSVSTVFERVELRRFIDTLQDRLPGTRIVVGGPAFARDATSWSRDELPFPSELGLPGASPERQ